MIKDMSDLVKMSLREDNQDTVKCDVTVTVNGTDWKAYEASVAYRDILLYCDKGTATFFVDSYGPTDTIELFEWDEN